ncbi:tetrahydrofolate dehydrogenase/cyclohydrolase catalytic domain-containing protein [Kamptonema formosum]|uniref:tetrahydrofolate dehydrogenase/cyclohydrolase catalytic domain-containing protein n=1 Tax=Kamptonema formosum TaxID=331992 RepID=UPI00034DD222|nr:tetrahydrofolate dehydrogenase/cyclohydrolase catalytic domain-containing protein [Oscillatoria sp. PCC 10802]
MAQLRGRDILLEVKQRCAPFRETFAGKSLLIIRFSPPPDLNDIQRAKYRAAEVSAVEKVKTFSFLNCEVDYRLLSENTTPPEFREIISSANSDTNTVGAIVQNPIPRLLIPELDVLSPEKDLDSLQENHPLFTASATSEAIARLVQSFTDENSLVAVVGGRGFVGRGAVRLLEQNGINCLTLDIGDDLTRTLEADIVVSATGQPELLDERHFRPYHRLVIDAGFVPIQNNVLGDVKRSAYEIPQNITPVPGGVGPLQMATLLERLVTAVTGITIEKWSYPNQTY